ncbi:MAG: hypothetical protein GY765_43705 [bacterium]|nr:hypothetical protein [bacterium]
MSARYSQLEQPNSVLRDSDDHGDRIDFSTKSDLKKSVKEYFKNYSCPSCGSHKCSGHGAVVKYGKVDFYREVSYKGLFGGTKYKDELYKTVWRIHQVGLSPGRKGGFLDAGIAPGRMMCRAKGCGWETVAPVYPKKSKITWYSINDLIEGKPFRR